MAWELSIFSAIILGVLWWPSSSGSAHFESAPDPMAIPLAALMVAAAAWAIPHGISLEFSEVTEVANWQRLRYPGTVATPLAYLVVSLRYVDHEDWLSRRVWAGCW